jgi:hypothetical protein
VAEAPPVRVAVPSGSLLVRQGSPVATISYLVRGCMAVECDGEHVNTLVPGKGAWVGEFWDPSFDAGSPHAWPEGYRAAGAEGCEVVTFDKAALHDFLSGHRGAGLDGLELAADAVVAADLRAKLEGTHRSWDADAVGLYEDLVALAVGQAAVSPSSPLQASSLPSEGGSQQQGMQETGRVSAEARALCNCYRRAHPTLISPACHARALAALGWTEEDYLRGHRGAAPGRGLRSRLLRIAGW